MKQLPSSYSEALAVGSKRYFTGRPCKHGHVDERRASDGSCCECQRAYARRKREEDSESAKAKYRSWWLENKDVARASSKAWREKNPEKYKESQRSWDARNQDVRRKMRRDRVARIKGAGGSHTAEEIESLLYYQSYRCAEPTCRKDLVEGYDVDHVMPLCLGGRNSIENLQCLCPSCNRSKGGMHPDEWREKRGGAT